MENYQIDEEKLKSLPYEEQEEFRSSIKKAGIEALLEKQKKEDKVEMVYAVGAIITGVIAFFGIWVYSFVSWGFLVGLAIGWLPAIIGGFIAGVLWPLILLGLLILFFMP